MSVFAAGGLIVVFGAKQENAKLVGGIVVAVSAIPLAIVVPACFE